MHSLLRHLAGALLLLWLVVTVVFALAHAAPGDPVLLAVGPSASADEIARARADRGLDAPLPVQYARWLGATLQGDLGESIAQQRSVRAIIADALPVSLFLGAVSFALSFVIGLAIGGAQARRRGSRLDGALTVLTTAVAAAPTFWLALGAIALFTYGAARLGFPSWARLPAFGLREPSGSVHGAAALLDLARHAVLPVAVLTAVGAAGIARYARSSLLDVVGMEFVRAARGRGVAGIQLAAQVVRVAAPGLLVLMALALPAVIAGSVFIETVFAWPGMGRAMVTAISARDYPVVLGATVLYSGAVILANLVADLLLPLVDPRTR